MSRLSRVIEIEGKARTPERYYDSTVTVADMAAGASRGRTQEQREAHKLAAIATEWVDFCADINASACAKIPLRLYRRAGRGRKSCKGWHGEVRPIQTRSLSRSQQRWQHDYRGSWGKAVSYAEGAGDVEEVMDHPILDVYRRPNHIQSGHEFEYQIQYAQEITGKAFRHRISGQGGVPVMFFFMSPLWTKIVPDRDGLIGGYVYGRDGTIEARFDVDEVDYFRHRPSLTDPYDGEGPLHGVFQSQQIWLAAHRGEAAWWENSARPDMLVEIDPAKMGPGVQWTEAQSKELQARINSALRGPDKRGRFLVVTASKISPMQFTPKDMEYLAGKTDLKQTILARFGVPESFATLNDANLASSITGHRQYQEMTLLPRLTRRADDETERLLPLFGVEPGEMWFGYDNPVRSDEAETATRAQMLVTSGIWTIDEARAEMGYDPLPEGGDIPRINGTPLDKVGVAQAPTFGFGQDRPALPAAEEDTDGGSNSGEDGESGRDDTDDEGEDRGGKHHGTRCGGPGARDCGPDERVQTKDDRAEPAFDRAVERWLRTTLGKVEVGADGSVTFPAGAADELTEALRPHWQQAFLNGRVNNGVVPGDGFNVLPAEAVRALDEEIRRVAESIVDTERQQALTAVRNGLEQGQSVGDITRAIREGTGDTPARAERIARTEEATATTQGNLSAWQEAGAKKRWALSPNACPLCVGFAKRFNAAQDAAEPFLRVGESYEDSTGQAHTVTFRDVQGPPLHPNCTCALEPVLEGE